MTTTNNDDDPAPGSVVLARVDRVSSNDLVVFCKVGMLLATLDATHLQDEWTDPCPFTQTPGQFIKAMVLHPSPFARSQLPALSIKKSLLQRLANGDPAVEVADDELVDSQALPQVGDLVTGYVHQTTNKGCFVRLSRLLTARVELKNLADSFVENVSESFPPGKLVAGRVLSVRDERRVELTLKKKALLGVDNDEWEAKAKMLNPGDVVEGRVRNVTGFGVFCVLMDSDMLVGLAHVDEAVENPASFEGKFKPGDRVKCKVVKVDLVKRRIRVGLKPSLLELESVEVSPTSPPSSKKMKTTTPSISLQQALASLSKTPPTLNDDDMTALTLTTTPHETTSTTTATTNNNKLNPKRREAARAKQLMESREQEHRLASADFQPSTVDDYERLLVAQPNSSMLYLQLMALLVSLTELNQARAVAERALKHISFREEEEKRNVWRAYLVMEIEFGGSSSDDDDASAAVQAVFQRMVKETEPKWAYMELSEAYAAKARESETNEQKNKYRAQAEDALKGARRASKQQSFKAWFKLVELKFDWGQANDGRLVFKDMMKHLPSRKHLKAMLRLARLEFTAPGGDKQKGRTVMEGVVANYPKRTDAWHVYIDLETKHQEDNSKVRELFERVLVTREVAVSVKNAKTFFKKWLTFEQSHGDESNAERVKQLAREFAESQ